MKVRIFTSISKASNILMIFIFICLCLNTVCLGEERDFDDFVVFDKLNLSFNTNTISEFENGIDTYSAAGKYEGERKKYVQGIEVIIGWNSKLKKTECQVLIKVSFKTEDYVEKVPFTLLGANKIYYVGKPFNETILITIPPGSASKKTLFIPTKVKGEANGFILGVPHRGTPIIPKTFNYNIIELKRIGR